MPASSSLAACDIPLRLVGSPSTFRDQAPTAISGVAAMAIQAVGYGSMAFQDEGRITLMIFSSLLTGMATSCGQTFGHAIKVGITHRGHQSR